MIVLCIFNRNDENALTVFMLYNTCSLVIRTPPKSPGGKKRKEKDTLGHLDLMRCAPLPTFVLCPYLHTLFHSPFFFSPC